MELRGQGRTLYKIGSQFPKVTSNLSEPVSRKKKHNIQVIWWLSQMLSDSSVSHHILVTHLLWTPTLREDADENKVIPSKCPVLFQANPMSHVSAIEPFPMEDGSWEMGGAKILSSESVLGWRGQV